MEESLYKLLLVSFTLLIVCGISHAGESSQLLSLGDLNVSGDYTNRPLISDFYANPSEFVRNYHAVQIRLLVLYQERQRMVEWYEEQKKAEIDQLKSQHRQMLMNRFSTGPVNANPESQWELDMSQNIIRQAVTNKKYSEKMIRWDSENGIVITFRTEKNRNLITDVRFMKDEASILALAE